jgi:serine/threonine-protein kinase RsbW
LGRFCITLDSDFSSLFLVSALIHGVCDHLGVEGDARSSVELCTVEAMTNAIKHAYRGLPGNELLFEMSYSPERLELKIRDQGVSMNREQIDKLANGSQVFDFDPEELDAVPEGGMGLEIIRREMDEARYTTDGGSNCFHLTKFLRPVESNEVRI